MSRDDAPDTKSSSERPGDLTAERPQALSARTPSAGRIGTYALLGAAASAVPFFWVPDTLVRRVRGAIVQDLASRYGLSLTPEARDVMCEPSGIEGPRGLTGQALRFFARRVLGRFGPLGILPPIRGALDTFALGHLFERYLATSRLERAARIDVDEARRVRMAIDRAMVRALSAEVRPGLDALATPPEELRDPVTKIVDGVLITIAGLPGYIVKRLDVAFDDVILRS